MSSFSRTPLITNRNILQNRSISQSNKKSKKSKKNIIKKTISEEQPEEQ